jgi:hypothetical protein
MTDERTRPPAALPRLSPISVARLLAVALGLAALGAGPAVASPAGATTDPMVEITIGYYQPDFDSSVRLDSSELGTGTEIDLERDLLVADDAEEVRGEVAIRLGRRNRLVLDYVSFDREGENTLSESITFGDVVYKGDVALRAAVESSHTGVAWRFSFVETPAVSLAFSLGASLLDVEASLEGEALLTADGVPIAGELVRETGDANGPVPLGGLHGRWWLGQRIRLAADARYFDIDDFEGWSGSLLEWGARLDWFLTPNVGLGAGWAATDIEADFEEESSLGSIDYAFDGWRAHLILAF